MSKFASSLTSSVSSYTGKEKYEFGDITKATVSKFTGKEDYKFGDITKAAADKISGAASSAVKQITGQLAVCQQLFFLGNRKPEIPRKESRDFLGSWVLPGRLKSFATHTPHTSLAGCIEGPLM